MTQEKLPQSSDSNNFPKFIAAEVAPVVALIGAIVLAAIGNENWGYFLVIAVFLWGV